MLQQGQSGIAELVHRRDVAGDQQQDALRSDFFRGQSSVGLSLEEQTHQVVARLATPFFQQIQEIMLQSDGGLVGGFSGLLGWCGADEMLEVASELTLIHEADTRGDLGQREVPITLLN